MYTNIYIQVMVVGLHQCWSCWWRVCQELKSESEWHYWIRHNLSEKRLQCRCFTGRSLRRRIYTFFSFIYFFSSLLKNEIVKLVPRQPYVPIPSHCAVLIMFKSVPVHQLSWLNPFHQDNIPLSTQSHLTICYASRHLGRGDDERHSR